MSQAIFIKGSISKHLFYLTLPAMLGLLANFSMGLVDSYFIAQLGDAPLTAIGYCLPMMELIIGIGIALGITTNSFAALELGKGRTQRAADNIGALLYGAFILTLVVMIVGMFGVGPMFRFLGANAAILEFIKSYYWTWLLGVFFTFGGFILNNAMRAHGKVKLPGILMVSMALLNIILDPLFIFGLWIFPQLGIQGAALATVVSRLFAFSVIFFYALKQGIFSVARAWHWVVAAWQVMSRVFIPALLTCIIPPFSIAFATYLLSSISQDSVAAFGVASRIQLLIMVPLFALSGSIGPVVGQNHGARLYQRAWKALTLSSLFCLAYGLLMALFLALTSGYLGQTFSSDHHIAKIVQEYFYLVPIGYMGWGVIIMVNACFNTKRKAMVSTKISLLRMIILFIPLAYFGKLILAYRGIFIALTLSNIIVACIAFYLAWLDMKSLALKV